MKVVRSLVVLSLLGAVQVGAYGGCAGDDPGTSTTGGNLFPGGTTAGTGSATNPAAGGTTAGTTGAVVPAMTAPGTITTVAPTLCSTQTIDAYGATPDMMIVLDRSLSMTLEGRWDPSKNAVREITTEFERLVSFGLVMFPGMGAPSADALVGALFSGAIDCSGGEQVDVPIKTMNATAINQAIDASGTLGLTPTGAGLTVALQALGDRKPGLDTVVKPGYVLLVTDGQPSCDPTNSLTGSADPAQEQAALAAVQALKAANIPTYVFGYQIAAGFQGFMNQLAAAGGTGSFHPAEGADQIVEAFRNITKDVVKCSFELSMVPANPKFVRVTIDKQTVTLDTADGWMINGKTVTLQGGSCTKLKDGQGHAVNAQIECKEIMLE